MAADRDTLLALFKRLTAQRVGAGLWSDADSDELAASIREALSSQDPERIDGAHAYLQTEVALLDEPGEMVRAANERMQARARERAAA